MSLLLTATEDYSGARCCLLNGLFIGLVLAAQATEKYLKACILFRDRNQKIKDYGHSLRDAVSKAVELEPSMNLKPFFQTIALLEKHYNSRYPDNPNGSRTAGTDELIRIDELLIYLNERLPMPIEVRLRSGLYAWICLCRDRRGFAYPNEKWLKVKNKALASILPRIYASYDALLAFEQKA